MRGHREQRFKQRRNKCRSGEIGSRRQAETSISSCPLSLLPFPRGLQAVKSSGSTFSGRGRGICVGGIKKSPQTQITHTEQQAIKWNTIGRRWGHMVGIWIAVGGGRHLRKRSLLNGNQMGCVLLNRIPGLQLWAGAWLGVLSPWPPCVQRGHGGGGRGWKVAGPEAVTERLPDPSLLAPRQCSSHSATLSPSPLPGSPN